MCGRRGAGLLMQFADVTGVRDARYQRVPVVWRTRHRHRQMQRLWKSEQVCCGEFVTRHVVLRPFVVNVVYCKFQPHLYPHWVVACTPQESQTSCSVSPIILADSQSVHVCVCIRVCVCARGGAGERVNTYIHITASKYG